MKSAQIWGREGWLGSEEVPRWFGLSLVVIYLAGLGAVAYYGITETRREALAQIERTSGYSLRSLARELAEVPMDDPAGTVVENWLQRSLQEARSHLPLEALRILDSRGRVLASTAPEEVGVIRPTGDVQDPKWLRSRILRPATNPPSGSEPPKPTPLLFVEGRLPPDLFMTSSLAQHAPVLAVVLAAFGGLFVVYRRLRAQLRGVSRVADRLTTHRDRIEEDLNSLRISDAADRITASWNQLITSAQGWHEALQRTEANAELAQVLQNSGNEVLSEALNAVPDGIVLVTQEVRFEYMNSMANRLFGWTPDHARQTTLPEAEARGVGKEALQLLRAALRPDGTFEPRSDVVEVADEQSRDRGCYRVHILPLHKAPWEGACVLLIRDVSQQVRADRAREDFVTQVTHELRTPLTNIRAYAETLASGMFDDPKVISDCYNVITKETRRLSRLIEDILSVSQLEVGTIELHMDSVDLKTLLADGVRDVRGLADEKNIDIQVALPAKLEPIRADRDKLAVVLNNLLGNAIKYTAKDGNVVVGCQTANNALMITVKDNGIGIDPADQAKIFEKFARGSNPLALAESGTGIGLYTAREIARRHGGDIEIMSEKGMGSTFMVRLPHQAGRASSVTAG